MKTPNLIAAGAGTTVGGALVERFRRGCTLARTGAGTVTVTLDAALLVDANECFFVITGETAAQIATMVNTSDSVKTIIIYNVAGAAAEGAFNFAIFTATVG